MDVLIAKLSVLCNGCLELMQDMGEWPATFPNGMTYQSRRFACKTCKTVSNAPMIITIIEAEGEPV